MKYRTNGKPSVRRHAHEAARGLAAAASMTARPRIYLSTHLDTPRTASSQCLLDDADIADTLKDAIGCITTIPMERLQVSVKDGWTTLGGTVESWAARDMIARIALRTVGVRGLINSITVNEIPFFL
jgi:osmotically-inducible protein OsmY